MTIFVTLHLYHAPMKTIVSLITLVFQFSTVIACSCENDYNPEFDFEKYEAATHVFMIEVTGIAKSELLGKYYSVEVINSFKGNSAQLSELFPDNMTSCSPPALGKGERYLFYIQTDEKELTSVSFDSCTDRYFVLSTYENYLERGKRIMKNRFTQAAFPLWSFTLNQTHQQKEIETLHLLSKMKTGVLEVYYVGAIFDFNTNTVTYDNKRLNFRGEFKDGKMVGDWQFFYRTSYLHLLREDDSLIENYDYFLWKVGQYAKDKRVGRWKEYDKNGVLVKTVEY